MATRPQHGMTSQNGRWALDERMAALGLPHRVEVFAGAHERPPAEVLSRAIGWMEVAALRRGRRPPSAELVEGVWGEELARAEGLARAGDAPAALAAYRGLAADFAGLRPAADLEAVARRAAALAAAPAVERAAAAERARDARDRAYLESVPRLLQTAGAEEAPERVARTLAGLGIPELQRSARDSPDPAERLSAERRLAAVYIQTGLYLPREAAERGQYDRAIFFLELAGAIEPGVPHVPFRLATAWAQKGDRAKALDYLALAVAKGWTDLVALEGERAFDPLRGSDEYRKIVGELLRRGKPSVR